MPAGSEPTAAFASGIPVPHAGPLEEATVHLWLMSLDVPPVPLSSLIGCLSPEEAGRAERFRFSRDRLRFVAGRGLLRQVLGSYVERDPSELRFVYNQHGKPFLAPGHRGEIEFNLSHSGGLGLLGVSQAQAIGVDIERIRPLSDLETIAERFFSPTEVKRFRGLSRHDRPRAFFNCWTRKEAYVKAVGGGLSVPLDSFDVSLEPGAPACVVGIEGSSAAAAHWSLWSIEPAADFVAAVATPVPRSRVVCRDWVGVPQNGVTS